MADVILAIVLLATGVSVNILLSRAWRLGSSTLAVLLPFFTLFGILLYFPASPFYVESDGEFYLAWGRSLAEFWAMGTPPMDVPLWPGKGFWPLIIGVFSYIAGPVVISLIVFNALLLTFTATVLHRTVSLLGVKISSWVLPIALLTSVPMLLFGPSLLREAIFWFGISLGGLAIAHAGKSHYRSAVIYALASASLLLAVRPDAGVVIAYGFVCVTILLFGFLGSRKTLSRMAASLLLVVLMGLSFPAVFDFMRPDTTASFIEVAASDLSNPSVTTGFGNTGSAGFVGNTGSAGFDESEAPSGVEFFCEGSVGGAVLCSAAENLPHALFGPFPWEYGPETIWLVAGASGLHFLMTLTLAGWYVFRARHKRLPALAIVAVALLSLIMFSSILTNYGILIRFRTATEIMLLPLAVSGLQDLLTQLKARRSARAK